MLAHGRWFSPGTPTSSTTKIGRHDIAESGVKHLKSNQTKHVGLVQRAHNNNLIECNLFSPRYDRKFAHLVLNGNISLYINKHHQFSFFFYEH